MEARDTLLQSGLDEKEISAYLTLLEIGESTVLAIAKKAGIKRPTAYLVLNSLESKGFVSRIRRRRQTFYAPQHPKKLISDAELHLKQMHETIPQLEAMMRKKDNRPRVVIYEGKDALDRAYDDYFIRKGEILFFTNVDVVSDFFERTDTKLQYISASQEYAIREIVIAGKDVEAYVARAKGRYRQVRIMGETFVPFLTDVGIFSDITLITSVKEEYFTVKIESQEIADAFRAMFEAMWRISSPVSN